MRRTKLLLLSLAALALVAGCGGASKPKVPSGAVAVVGSVAITKAEFDSYLATAKRSYAIQHKKFPAPGSSGFTQLSGQLVAFLVERSEYDQKAKQLGITITDKQVNDRLQAVKKQYFSAPSAGSKKPATPAQIEQRYRKQIAKSGISDSEVRAGIRYQLIREALYKKIGDKVTVSDGDAKSYYDSHKSQYQQPAVPESRDVREILVKSQAIALSIYQQLKKGADFTALVTKYSKDPGSKSTGGRLTVCKQQSVGCIKTVSEFENAAFSLKPNEISKPVHSKRYGWFVIQALGPVKAPQSAHAIPYSQVKDGIKQQLLQTKRQRAINDWWNAAKQDFAKHTAYAIGYAPPAVSTTSTSTTG